MYLTSLQVLKRLTIPFLLKTLFSQEPWMPHPPSFSLSLCLLLLSLLWGSFHLLPSFGCWILIFLGHFFSVNSITYSSQALPINHASLEQSSPAGGREGIQYGKEMANVACKIPSVPYIEFTYTLVVPKLSNAATL